MRSKLSELSSRCSTAVAVVAAAASISGDWNDRLLKLDNPGLVPIVDLPLSLAVPRGEMNFDKEVHEAIGGAMAALRVLEEHL